ncbi:hypothetical protein CHX27_05740 [Flavobacterium aurantiibacter]|uniref:Uncharacterized protein n=1 Tax=Flavobacterium aurantiibacter TaxID=2023067 RepID=A0A255ZVQ8_9FLAO|nr:hypothetical protein CHX27_05740 [Flavobacterium aurantiibacter]
MSNPCLFRGFQKICGKPVIVCRFFFKTSPRWGRVGWGAIPTYEIPGNKFYGKTVNFTDFEIERLKD